MTTTLRQGLTALACIAGIFVLLMVTTLTSKLRTAKATQYELLCDVAGQNDATEPHHMIFFLDVNACLTCNEDMDAWRELVTYLRENDLGTVTVFCPRADSADVQWAMQLEGICDSVKVLEQETIEALGWTGLGIPVKLLLDSRCRPIEIMNWLGTAQQSREFVQRVIGHIETTSGKR
jgi:hypothetical protein